MENVWWKNFVHHHTISDSNISPYKISTASKSFSTSWSSMKILAADLGTRITFRVQGDLKSVIVDIRHKYEKNVKSSSKKQYSGIHTSINKDAITFCELSYDCLCCEGKPLIFWADVEPKSVVNLPVSVSKKLLSSEMCQCDDAMTFTLTFNVNPLMWSLPALPYLQDLFGGVLSDVVLRAGGKDLKAHRCFLAASSPVFKAMFQNENFKENSTGVVEIEDSPAEAVEALLEHLYGRDIRAFPPFTLVDVLILSEKYQMEHLKSLCEDQLSKESSEDSIDAMWLLGVADKVHAKKVREAVLERIKRVGDTTFHITKESVRELVGTSPEAASDLITRLLEHYLLPI